MASDVNTISLEDLLQQLPQLRSKIVNWIASVSATASLALFYRDECTPEIRQALEVIVSTCEEAEAELGIH